MVQPTKPPVSIRLPEGLPERVGEWATAHKVSRNAAYAQLIELGLKACASGLPAPERQAEIKRSVAARRAKPAASATPKVSVNVPFGGDLVRRPVQKMPRGPKK